MSPAASSKIAIAVRGERIAAVLPVDAPAVAHFPVPVTTAAAVGHARAHRLPHASRLRRIRAARWEMRLAGVPYAEIARRGGGILSTVRATRAMTEDELVAAALPRCGAGRRGRDVRGDQVRVRATLDDELKMLRAARRLAASCAVEVSPTLLAAHAVPPEFAGRADDYVSLIVEEMIPAVAAREAGRSGGRVLRIDRVLGRAMRPHLRRGEAARPRGEGARRATLELARGGTDRAASAAGRPTISNTSTMRAWRRWRRRGRSRCCCRARFTSSARSRSRRSSNCGAAGVPMAVGTDLNPGTSPFASLRLAMNMACVLFGLTPEEALAGATREAAKALGRGDRLGTLEAGKQADFLVWDVRSPGRDRVSAWRQPASSSGSFAGGSIMPTPDMSVWTGRVDTADGPRALRWHQMVQAADDRAASRASCWSASRATRACGATAAASARRTARGRFARRSPTSPGIRSDPVYDAGDVRCDDGDMEGAQARLAEAVAERDPLPGTGRSSSAAGTRPRGARSRASSAAKPEATDRRHQHRRPLRPARRRAGQLRHAVRPDREVVRARTAGRSATCASASSQPCEHRGPVRPGRANSARVAAGRRPCGPHGDLSDRRGRRRVRSPESMWFT